jgi:hypothetical protein
MIKSFNLFYDEHLFENLINESILYYSKDTRKILNQIKDNKIAQDLLSIEATDVKPDITFINLDKEGYLSFITMKNAIKLITDEYPYLHTMDKVPNRGVADELWDLKDRSGGAGIYDKSRNSIALGKFVNKLFPGKYNDREREEFVNKFKAVIDKGEEFELVEGEDINHWYWYENYLENKGTLGSSCMREKRGLFGIYTENPEVCKLLILKDGDKIVGRALVWKLNSIKKSGRIVEGPEWFMDRQYTILESDVEKFRTYAKERGWVYKSNNNHHSFERVIYNGEEFNAELKVEVKAKDYRRYPYMDTFRRFDTDTGFLYNDDERSSDYAGQYILEDTGGGYEEIEAGVWSEYHYRRIPEEDAVWSECVDSYLDRDSAVHVTTGFRRHLGWYPDDYDDIVFDEWIEEYIHVDDSVYSEHYGYYIYDVNAVSVIHDIESDGDIQYDDYWMHVDDKDILHISKFDRMNWYKFLSNKFNNWDNFKYILVSELTKDSYDNWIPRILERKIYKVTDPKDDSVDLGGVSYLSEEDAIALDWNINYNEEITIDIVQYSLNIREIIEKIKNRLDNKIKQLNSIIKGDQKRIEFEDEKDYINKITKLKRKLLIRLTELENEEWHEDL